MVWYEMLAWLKEAQRWARLRLVGEFHGRPQYVDVETGEKPCPFREEIMYPEWTEEKVAESLERAGYTGA